MTFARSGALLLLVVAAPVLATPSYRSAGAVALGVSDRWDYLVADVSSGRIYVAHGDQLNVIDGRTGQSVGAVNGIAGGTHGTGIVGTHGVTDDGRSGDAGVSNTRTLGVLRRISADADADGIAVDPETGHALVVSGDPGTVAIIDLRRGKRLAVVAGKDDLVAIDLHSDKAATHCTAP